MLADRVEARLDARRGLREPEAALDPGRGARRELAVGRVLLVGVRRPARLVQARLQLAARRVQRVARAGAGRRVDHGRQRLGELEEGDGLDGRRRVDARQLRRPRSGGDDRRPGAQAAGRDAVAVLIDRVDPVPLADLEAVCERGHRPVGVDDPAVGLEEAVAAGLGANREAPFDLGRVQHLERGPAGGERVAVRLPVAEVERAVEVEQRRGRSPPRARARAESSPARAGPSARPDRRGGRSASCRGSSRGRARARTARRRRRRVLPARAPVRRRGPSRPRRRRRPRCRRRPRAAA